MTERRFESPLDAPVRPALALTASSSDLTAIGNVICERVETSLFPADGA